MPRWSLRTTRVVHTVFSPGLRRRTLASVVDGTPPIQREEAIRLRQYQEDCIQSVLAYLQNGHKRLGVSLATGSGKTVRTGPPAFRSAWLTSSQVIFTQLIDRINPQNDRARQTLILAHRRELVEQAARHCGRLYPNKSIEIEMGEIHASGAADITIASVRSMLSGDRLTKFDPSRFKLILVDEAHHIVAPGYLDALQHFGLREPTQNSPVLIGVSATFSRFDGLRLGAVIDHIVYHKDYVDMIGEKWLSDVMFTTIKSKANLARVRSGKDGDFNTAQLSRAVNTDETNEITVKSWLSEAGDRKSTLVFCVDLGHVSSLTSMFRKHGIDARFITGETRKQIRAERLEAFKRREFPVLLNCGVFTEGTDIPNIDCILLARPTKSRNLLVQMIGRGMRLYPGKENCHIIDMVASLETGIVTVPTLFGLDPSEVVKHATAVELRSLKKQRDEDNMNVSAETRNAMGSHLPGAIVDARLDITHYDTVHDLIEDTSGERHVRALSQNAWVQVDRHKYILNARGGVLTLEKVSEAPSDMKSPEPHLSTEQMVNTSDPALFKVTWKHSLPPGEKSKSPYSKLRTVATASTLSSALNAADTFAATKFERIFIATSSPWRRSPASESQLSFLNNLRVGDGQEPLTTEMITKGQAGDMITKVKFGAKGRFERMSGEKRRMERRKEKVEELRRKEEVKVGPLET